MISAIVHYNRPNTVEGPYKKGVMLNVSIILESRLDNIIFWNDPQGTYKQSTFLGGRISPENFSREMILDPSFFRDFLSFLLPASSRFFFTPKGLRR